MYTSQYQNKGGFDIMKLTDMICPNCGGNMK